MGVMTRGWWRRNAWPLALLTVLVPVTVAAVAGNEWYLYYSGRASQPVTAEPGATAQLGGATWGPAETAPVPGGLDVPAGARVVAVTIPVAPGDEAVACLRPVLREAEGAGRQWDEASTLVDWPYDADEPSSCVPDETRPYSLVVPFLVPGDAAGRLYVDITVADEAPRFVRLAVDG